MATRSRHEVIGALATCATARSREAILQYTWTLPRLATGYTEDMLVPLVRRGVLSEEDVVDVVRNRHALVDGRIACILALAQLTPRTWTSLFRELLSDESDPALQHASIVAGALGRDHESIPQLVQKVGDIASIQAEDAADSGADDVAAPAWIAATAALALANLGHTEAVSVIETVAERFPWRPMDLARIVAALGQLAAPSSLPFLLRVSQNPVSKQVMDEAVKALGNYLAEPEAEEVVLQALASGSGGYADRGSQLAALKTLARRDPYLLLAELRGLYRLGHLDSSARQSLAILAPNLAGAEGIDGTAFAELLGSLASDRAFWVREMIYQTVDRIPGEFVAAARMELASSADPWRQACAVRLSGILDGDALEFEAARTDPDGFIRDAGDAVAEARTTRAHLEGLIERFGSRNPSVRCAAFFALESHGDEWAMHRLVERYPEGTPASAWIGSLDAAVQVRRRNEHRERGRDEDRRSERLSTVTFD